MLSFRTSATVSASMVEVRFRSTDGVHSGVVATEIPAKLVDDSSLSIRIDDKNILQDLTGTTNSCGITTYDGNTLNDIFRSCRRSWHDTLCPRIFTVQAVIFLDATVFKFTMQHVAGDAVGQYLTNLR
jgi:hypothetical protein